ncbi:diguanylate cyclase (GGDEF) domain protein [[Clostridium] hylemonae DSM 15053]|uniref:Diguanylate cyclase (GGDEF) domain protein n=4 Tax=[Clostridium] hylemonae TaxID=89153 RepID=C0C2R0_9FIRM|nr:diguanylate cyclase (GGDEF) domain protein [[Clostridium] hylemonae DSM 15053]
MQGDFYMKENKIRKRLVLFMTAAAVMSFIVVMVLACRSGRGDSARYEKAERRYMDKGVSVLQEDGREEVKEYPCRSDGKEGYFYYKLPEDIEDNAVLVLPNVYQKIEVTLNGKLLYTYGMDQDSPYYMEARLNCAVRLPDGSGGRELEIHLVNTEKMGKASLQQGYLTTAGELSDSLLADNLWAFLFCVLTAMTGMCILAVSLWQYIGKAGDLSRIFFCLGQFALLSAVWVFTDSGLPQLIFNNSQGLMVLSFEVFMLMPVPLLQFVQLVCEYSRRALRVLVTGYIVNFFLQNAAYALKLSDFKKMVYLTHIVMVASITAIIYFILKEARNRHSMYAKWVLAGVGIFAGFACMSLVSYYVTGGIQNEKFFITGFFIFLAVLIILATLKFQEFSKESARAAVLKELAYKDMMTGIGNRTLYEEHIAVYESAPRPEAAAVIILDINNLKDVNDRFGHRAGDELLILAARCLREAFGIRGTYYRIGGDEFAVILKEADAGEEECRRLLGRCIEKNNAGREIRLSVSMGYAAPDAGKGAAHIRELIEKADARMYEEKRRYHAGR